MTKNLFIYKHTEAGVDLSHFTKRQLDYRYKEYMLFNIIIRYSDIYDFTLLGLPKSLDIKFKPNKDEYNIYKTNHVTINSELYRLYKSGYFSNEYEFIVFITVMIKKYEDDIASIKILVDVIRNIRLNYENEIKYLIV